MGMSQRTFDVELLHIVHAADNAGEVTLEGKGAWPDLVDDAGTRPGGDRTRSLVGDVGGGLGLGMDEAARQERSDSTEDRLFLHKAGEYHLE